jgi:hypothetical protein
LILHTQISYTWILSWFGNKWNTPRRERECYIATTWGLLNTFSHFESHCLPAFAPHQNLHMHPKSSSTRRAVYEAKLHMDRLVWTSLQRTVDKKCPWAHRNQHLA